LARGVAGVQPLDVAAAVDEGEQPAGARGGEAERVRESVGRKGTELAGGCGRTELADRRGWVESALAQVGMAGAADRDHRLVAGDDRLHQRLAVAVAGAAGRKRRRYHHTTRMHRGLAGADAVLGALG